MFVKASVVVKASVFVKASIFVKASVLVKANVFVKSCVFVTAKRKDTSLLWNMATGCKSRGRMFYSEAPKG